MSTEPDLMRAARTVFDGLNARIDAAVDEGDPIPVFDGIADLHDAWQAARQQAVPSGFLMVPVACTSEMEDAYDRACLRDGLSAVYLHLPAYEAMLAAAPQASPALGTELDQPQYTAGDMADQAAKAFRDGQAAPPAPDVSGLVEAIQKAAESVSAPEGCTPSRQEYFKWGARSVLQAVNAALAAHQNREGKR